MNKPAYMWEYLTALIRLSNQIGEATDQKVASRLINQYEIYEKTLFKYTTVTNCLLKTITYKKKKYYFNIKILENTTEVKWQTKPWDK